MEPVEQTEEEDPSPPTQEEPQHLSRTGGRLVRHSPIHLIMTAWHGARIYQFDATTHPPCPHEFFFPLISVRYNTEKDLLGGTRFKGVIGPKDVKLTFDTGVVVLGKLQYASLPEAVEVTGKGAWK